MYLIFHTKPIQSSNFLSLIVIMSVTACQLGNLVCYSFSKIPVCDGTQLYCFFTSNHTFNIFLIRELLIGTKALLESDTMTKLFFSDRDIQRKIWICNGHPLDHLVIDRFITGLFLFHYGILRLGLSLIVFRFMILLFKE